MTVKQGDDFSGIGQGPISWTLTNAPNLALATITLEISRGGVILVTTPGVLASGVWPAAQVVTVALTDTQTGTLSQRNYAYRLAATLSNTDIVTLDSGGPGSLYATPRTG